MRPLIWLPLRDVYRADSGVEILTNGSFSAWTGADWTKIPTGWTVTSPGTLANHVTEDPVGSLRTVSDGGFVQLLQSVLTIGVPYVATIVVTACTGTFSLTGATNYIIIGAPGTYTINFTADAVNLLIKRGTACDVTVDSISVRGMQARSKNLGSAGDYVIVGDGLAVASMPTMLTPSVNVRRGMAFNGSQYLQLAPALPSLTAVTAIIQFSGLTKARNYPGLIGKRIDATHGWALTAELSAGKRIPTFYCRGTNQYVAGTYDVADGAVHTVMGVYDPIAGVASVYVDGRLDGSGSKTSGLDGGAVDGTYIGGDGVAFLGAAMNAYQSAVFPIAFSPQQVAMMHERLMSQVST